MTKVRGGGEDKKVNRSRGERLLLGRSVDGRKVKEEQQAEGTREFLERPFYLFFRI